MRAVLLEVAHSLTTDTFLKALRLRRFIFRRGKPLRISSEKSSNLVEAENSSKVATIGRLHITSPIWRQKK